MDDLSISENSSADLEPIVEEESIELEEDAVLINNKNTCNTLCGSVTIGSGSIASNPEE